MAPARKGRQSVLGAPATRHVAREPGGIGALARVPFVVDASVSAAWFLPDEATEFTRAALRATVDVEVWVPALWLPEMANLLLGAQRRRRITALKRRELVSAAAELRLQVCREPVSLLDLDALGAEHGLSAYDACYLELALRRGLPLATLDQGLQAAMKRCGVPTVEFTG